MKIKLFTHTDLDGVGCAIIGILAYEKENIDIIYCNYNDINEKVKEFIENGEYKNYDKIFITDISVNEEIAKMIDDLIFYKEGFITLLDHHATASFLNQYWFGNVIAEYKNVKTSGTSLFYEYLSKNINVDDIKLNKQNIKDFVENVRQYDTWEWKTKFNNEEPKQWNDLLYIMGRDEFINQMIYKLTMYDAFDFNSIEDMLLRIEENKKQKYFADKQREMTIHALYINNKLYAVGIIFAEQYLSELGNILATNNEQFDFVMIISGCKTISFRTVKDNIDLGKDIASVYGGGGHPKAAGSQITEDIKQQIIDLILD